MCFYFNVKCLRDGTAIKFSADAGWRRQACSFSLHQLRWAAAWNICLLAGFCDFRSRLLDFCASVTVSSFPCALITLRILTRYNEVFILRTDPIHFQLLAREVAQSAPRSFPSKIDLTGILPRVEHKGASGTDLRGLETPQVVGQTLCGMTLSSSCPVADITHKYDQISFLLCACRCGPLSYQILKSCMICWFDSPDGAPLEMNLKRFPLQ